MLLSFFPFANRLLLIIISEDKTMVKLNDEKTLTKWTKFVEAIILMVMGLMFFIIAFISDEDIGYGLSYAVGVVCAIYGVIIIATEYLVKRLPITNKSIAGVVFTGLAVALFVNPEAINSLLSELLLTVTFVLSALLIIYSTDLLIRNHKMQKAIEAENSKEDNIDLNMIAQTRIQKKKNINMVILCFILAGVLIIGGVLFCYFYYYREMKTIDQLILMIYGIGVFIYGIILFIRYYRNNREIKQAQIAEENRRKEELRKSQKVDTDDVKVITLSELEKDNRRKKTSSKTAETDKMPVANERGEISIDDLAAATNTENRELSTDEITLSEAAAKKKARNSKKNKE